MSKPGAALRQAQRERWGAALRQAQRERWGGALRFVRSLVGRLAALLLAAVSTTAQPAVQVVDDAGVTVTLAAPARRIVSLAPHATELLFALGAGERVVGADAYSDFPAAARRIPRVGDASRLDLERVLALAPDLIVVWGSGTPAQQVERLRRLGIPIYAMESRRLAGIAGTLRRLGRLAGREAEGEARAQRYEQALQALRAAHAGRRVLPVFYQIWHRPLLTLNGEHLIDDALALCGARNVFAGLGPLTPSVSVEAVLAQDPEAIVTGSIDPAGPDNLALWRRLGPSVRAVRLGNLIVVDPNTLHRQSERVLEGTRELCAKLEAARSRGG